MALFDIFGNIGNIREKIAETRQQLEVVTIEKEKKGITVAVSAGKNIKHIDIPDALLGIENKAEMTQTLIHILNVALNEAEGIAVKEVKNAGGKVIPGFSKMFG